MLSIITRLGCTSMYMYNTYISCIYIYMCHIYTTQYKAGPTLEPGLTIGILGNVDSVAVSKDFCRQKCFPTICLLVKLGIGLESNEYISWLGTLTVDMH